MNCFFIFSYQIPRIYPAPMRTTSLYADEMRILASIHFLGSFPQMMDEIYVGNTNPNQTRNPICIPEYPGIICRRKSKLMIIMTTLTNSASMIFHIPTFIFSISDFVSLSAQWIFVQILPKKMLNHTAPPTNAAIDRTIIANQSRCTIQKGLGTKMLCVWGRNTSSIEL